MRRPGRFRPGGVEGKNRMVFMYDRRSMREIAIDKENHEAHRNRYLPDPVLACSLGEEFRKMRIASRHSIKQMSAKTNLQQDYIKAMEAGDFRVLPGGIYNASFTKIYAQSLGLDVDHALSIYINDPRYSTAFERERVVITKNFANEIKVQKAKRPKRPPVLAEYLLYFFLTRMERVCLIGDLNEEFTHVLKRFGMVKAKWWYYKQVFDSLWPLLRRSISKVSVVAWIIEMYHKLGY